MTLFSVNINTTTLNTHRVYKAIITDGTQSLQLKRGAGRGAHTRFTRHHTRSGSFTALRYGKATVFTNEENVARQGHTPNPQAPHRRAQLPFNECEGGGGFLYRRYSVL